jgi:streptogramin lyase
MKRLCYCLCLLIVVLSFGSGCLAADSGNASRSIITYAGTGQPGNAATGESRTNCAIANPYGLVRGPDGALYICEIDNHIIRRIGTDGRISIAAGNGQRGFAGAGGSATEATLNEPYEVRFDRAGNMWFVDMKNHVVQKVDTSTRILTTVAGTGKAGFSGDGGPALRAQLNQPHSIQLDRDGNLFICDIANHRIRRVDARTGIIMTFAGNGQKSATPDGGRFVEAALYGPRAIDFDREGNLWLALREGNAVYKLDLRAGTIHHVAGTGKKGFTGHGGPAASAALSGPKGLSIGPEGNVYLADTESHSVRMIDVKTGRLELVAGTGERGDGPAGDPLQCRMSRPHGVFVDEDGAVWIGDSEAHRVRVIASRSNASGSRRTP